MGIEQAQNLCGKGKRAERKWVIEGKLKGKRETKQEIMRMEGGRREIGRKNWMKKDRKRK